DRQRKLESLRRGVEALDKKLAERLPNFANLKDYAGDSGEFFQEILKGIDGIPQSPQEKIDDAKARLGIALMEALLPEPEPYYLKGMNCPHHHRIFAAEPRSYRDLPLRLAEYGTCYRYEQSGELVGLMRVRSLNMNDAHIYCTEEQFAAEFNAVNEMYLKY